MSFLHTFYIDRTKGKKTQVQKPPFEWIIFSKQETRVNLIKLDPARLLFNYRTLLGEIATTKIFKSKIND
jgi:hypothetical protein